MKKVVLALFVFVMLFYSNSADAMFITSNFNVDDEGWTANGAVVSHESTGGNHGGFLKIEDTRDDTFSVFAPSKFQGDLSQFNGGLLSYDVIVLDPTTQLTSIGSGFGRIQLQGGGSNATFDYSPDPPIPSALFWKTYFVPMTADAWHTTPENWDKVLSDVTNVDIILEPNNWSTVGLDNFKVAAVPEPVSLFLMGGGLLGMFGRRRRNNT